MNGIYDRDLRGYGPDAPDPQWPDNAKVAVQFVVNYEEGGENCLLHGDAASEAFLSEIVGAQPWIGERHWNMESIYEYGARAGFWRLYRLFERFRVPVTVFGVATALARSPEQTSAMIEAGWEMASHGLKWIEYRGFSEEEERNDMLKAVELHAAVTGSRPLGWYTGRCSMNTVRLAAELGEFEYVADSYADELPYWAQFGSRSQLVVPYTLDANDMRFATAQGFNSGRQFFDYLKDTFDVLHDEGSAGSPKMMSIGLHCRLAGRPGRARAISNFLEYAKSREGVWFARRMDIARHWKERFPPPASSSELAEMSAAQFVDVYGGVFEHSPWVAERAFGLERGAAHNCPRGVHSLLCRAFRSASGDERLAVVRAHPDLAGKLARSRRLTKASQVEQASAGLDALTANEQARFEDLNNRYTRKFGFPFIIAVKDHTKAEIVGAFERRLENSSEEELDEACRQVERIAWYRVLDLLKGR